MGYGNFMIESQSPRCCYSTEEHNERLNDQSNTIEEKLYPDWFHLPNCDVCKIHREFTNNVFSYQPTHKSSLSGVFCKLVYIDYYCSYKHNPTCSRVCHVK